MENQQLKFKCPKCSATELIEHVTDAFVRSSVDVYSDGLIEITERAIHWTGKVSLYGCSQCSFRIYKRHEGINSPVTDPEELVAWLKDRQ